MPRPGHGLAREGQVAVVQLELVQRRDAIEGTRRSGHQLGADAVTGQARNGLGHSILLSLNCRADTGAHSSCASVDVCGVQGRVSDISP